MRTVKLTLGTSAVTALAVAALAGCAGSTAGADSGTGSAAATATGSATAAGPAAGSAAAVASGAASTGTASAVPAATRARTGDGTAAAGASGTACRTSDLSLRVIQGPQGPSGPGSFYIQLTNVSSGTCTLYGFPGVDLADGNGASLGMKDDWTVKLAMTGGEKVQTLAPHAASAAYVTYVSKPAAQAKGDPLAVEVRVIPPDQTTALTAKIYNVYQGDIQLPVASKTLMVGPMDIDGIPHA